MTVSARYARSCLAASSAAGGSSAAALRQLERPVGELGRLGAAERLVAQRQREQHLAQQLRVLEVGRRAGGRQRADGASSSGGARAPPPNSRPGCLSGIVATIAPGGRVDDVDLAAQTGALERQPVAGQPQVAELGGQLGERRPPRARRLQLRLVQRDLGAGVGQRRVGVGRDQQERLRPEPAGADAGDVGQQLIAAEAERADDPRRERVRRRDVRVRSVIGPPAIGRRQLSSRPPTMPPSSPPPPWRCAFAAARPPAPADGSRRSAARRGRGR